MGRVRMGRVRDPPAGSTLTVSSPEATITLSPDDLEKGGAA